MTSETRILLSPRHLPLRILSSLFRRALLAARAADLRDVGNRVLRLLVGEEARGGAGVRFLSGRVTSPTLAAQREALRQELPEARWVSWEPADRDNASEYSVHYTLRPVPGGAAVLLKRRPRALAGSAAGR